jgi:hypothetical protein
VGFPTEIERTFQSEKWTPTAQRNRAGGSFPEPLGKNEIMKLIIYRILSVLLVVDLVAIVYFLTMANLQKTYLTLAFIPAI